MYETASTFSDAGNADENKDNNGGSVHLTAAALSERDAALNHNTDDNGGGGGGGADGECVKTNAFARESQFLPTARRINQFSNNKLPPPGARVVYIDGTWDMFHAGHVETLAQAAKLGDFLLVGVYGDDLANSVLGSTYPILNLHERVLSGGLVCARVCIFVCVCVLFVCFFVCLLACLFVCVGVCARVLFFFHSSFSHSTVLSCRYVDEVIIGAPLEVTRDLLTSMNIQVRYAGVP
jgi:ethanolamine-phosphate cytidylyltransferase